jgi:hypothetical protein
VLPIHPDVIVELETYRQDGTVGLARWAIEDLVCMFQSDEFVERALTRSWFWIYLKQGSVVRIQEQYVP